MIAVLPKRFPKVQTNRLVTERVIRVPFPCNYPRSILFFSVFGLQEDASAVTGKKSNKGAIGSS